MSDKCRECGKFTSSEIYYAPWGNTTDYEPPELRFLCQKCWDKKPKERKEALTDSKRFWIPVKESIKEKGERR